MEALSPEVADADVEDVHTIGRKGTGRGRVEILTRERSGLRPFNLHAQMAPPAFNIAEITVNGGSTE